MYYHIQDVAERFEQNEIINSRDGMKKKMSNKSIYIYNYNSVNSVTLREGPMSLSRSRWWQDYLDAQSIV